MLKNVLDVIRIVCDLVIGSLLAHAAHTDGIMIDDTPLNSGICLFLAVCFLLHGAARIVDVWIRAKKSRPILHR